MCRYITQGSRSPDLAIFTDAVRSYANLNPPNVDIREPGFNLLGEHFHPMVAVLAPGWWLWPSPMMLLAAQAALTAVSVVPVYRAAAQHLDPVSARILTVAYAGSWGLATMVEFDFHEIAFAVPLLASSLSALTRGHITATVGWALPLVAVKENQGLTLVALGAVMALAYRQRLAGAGLAAWGAAWSMLSIFVIIPAINPDGEYLFMGDGGLAGILAGIDVKVSTLVLVLLPTAFVALRSPLVIVAAPALALRFVSTNDNHWGVWYHYSAVLMPNVFIAAAEGLARLRGNRSVSAWVSRHAAAMMLIAAAALAYLSPLKYLWDPDTYRIDAHDRAVAQAASIVPDGATVEASISALAPLAARTEAYFWGDTVPEWIVYDEQSFEWDTDVEAITDRHDADYVTVYHREDVWVLRRANWSSGP